MDENSAETDAFSFFQRKKESDFDPTKHPLYDSIKYNMSHGNRGVAIVLNHFKFSIKNIGARSGTDKDRDDICQLLKELKFDVTVGNDYTYSEIRDLLTKVSKMDHSDNDCLVVVVMSHGDDGILYAKDTQYSTDTLWKQFRGDKCPTLVGKPKLFFIQACRGDQYDNGAVMEDASRVERNYTVPAMADILVMYSTVEGYFAWRHPVNGSYFIQALIKQLREHYMEKDLLSILTYVNRQVAINFALLDRDREFKQMCSIVSMLTREVYFSVTENND